MLALVVRDQSKQALPTSLVLTVKYRLSNLRHAKKLNKFNLLGLPAQNNVLE